MPTPSFMLRETTLLECSVLDRVSYLDETGEERERKKERKKERKSINFNIKHFSTGWTVRRFEAAHGSD